jgi:hypothetical protein
MAWKQAMYTGEVGEKDCVIPDCDLTKQVNKNRTFSVTQRIIKPEVGHFISSVVIKVCTLTPRYGTKSQWT